MVKFYGGDIIKISGKEYTLVKRLGGFQFRNWKAKDNFGNFVLLKIGEGKKEKIKEFTNELSIYQFLINKGYEKRYYPRPLNLGKLYRKVKERFNFENFYGFVLKYYEAETLKDFLERKQSKKTLDKVKDKIIRRIERLHKSGVVHTDLNKHKENILITKSNVGLGVKILDFASSKTIDDFRDKKKFNKESEKEEQKMKVLLDKWFEIR